ncbi:ATP-dependent zinc metalloprotease YME1L isoform X2 [Cryptotermes secundus]|uniref:ATP-dependent zinc metalloprotease YME1L isoform X2 n=1 Tax=Cryptotermes secundus TaxID=105785 RepID=UPI000CD7DC2E|nr:ATP-dependent zinc metalloprotease YME1L isoform X2 [Cryptotermes secundus]
MFTLQNNNQVLFHLTQLTSAALNPRRPCSPLASGTKSSRPQQGAAPQTDGDVDIICSHSLNTAVNNCSEFIFKHLPKINGGCADGLVPCLFWNQLTTQPLLKTKLTSPWQINYSSSESFFENKHGFPQGQPTCCGSSTSIVLSNKCTRRLLHSMLVGRPFLFDIHVRGFKTERSIMAERIRNPTIGMRLRQAFGLSYTGGSPLGHPGISSTSVGKVGSFNQPEVEAEKLKDETMSTEEQHRMKVAFAEGYLEGSGQKAPGRTMKWLKVIQQLLIIVIFLAIFVSFMASASGSVFRIQLGNQVEVDPEEIHVTFEDVKGVDEAKQELKDVVEFLKNPEKFSALGGKLPKGVLLVGPPGTGKTLLARAVAGEAGVPFFHAAGSEFDEILVGQGARRVRDLFRAAKDRAPCVIFIDEIDSVGAKRTNSVLHPYANQTINQLLSEMDGFHQNEGVIVLGATNRRDDLDKALLRPGRFDVEVTVPTPDYVGRKEILDLYLGKVLSKDIDVEILARGTTGFTGADLESMVNQAALRAAIDGADSVTMKYLENARDKVLMGPERKGRIPDEEANMITAYHEGGHAVVAYFTKDSHPLHKVTIIPRGPSLGHTAYIPEKERYHVTKSQLLAMMDTMMGGRAAEELVFGPEKITSGASSDLKQATAIAIHMVKDWGMSERVGLRTHDGNNSGFVVVNELSPGTNELIDSEIKRIMTESYERAKNILKTHQREHKMLAEALLKYETLDAEDIKSIMAGKQTPDKTHPV